MLSVPNKLQFIGNATCIVGTAVVTYAPQDQRILRLVFYYFHSFQSVGFAMSLVVISAVSTEIDDQTRAEKLPRTWQGRPSDEPFRASVSVTLLLTCAALT